MRIAVVAGEYPTPRAPEKAMFVRDQVEALRAAGHQVVVVHHDPPTLRRLAGRVRRQVIERAARAPRSTSATQPPAAVGQPTTPAQPIAREEPTSSTRAIPAVRTVQTARTLARVAHDAGGRAIAAAAMVRDLRRLDPKPQIVHAHNVFPAGLAAVSYGAREGVPVVVTEHSSAFLRKQLTRTEIARASQVYKAAAAVIAVSPRQAEALPTENVTVVPNVLPADFTLRSPQAGVTGPIVSVGTLMAHKGMDVLLRAYASLPESLRQRHGVVIVGDGPDAPRLHSLAAWLGVHDRVSFTGHLPRVQVAGVMREAAVLVSASPVETFGMTLIEALACGVPFVAPRSGGPQSVWFPGAGELVDQPTAGDLAAGLQRILQSGRDQSTDAARRAEVQRRFGAEQVTAQVSEIYRAATGSGGERTER